jgi:transaldolase
MSSSSVQRLHDLNTLGQSPWLDEINRSMLVNGELVRMIEQGVRGVTTNPAIFQQAFAKDAEYRKVIDGLKAKGQSGLEVYESLVIEDVQAAADKFRRLYDQSQAQDGFVSIEVPPALANDAIGTVAEAKRLWAKINRPNIMIKVPATDQGVLAVRQLIAAGIHVNVTLIFGIARYKQVLDAHMAGLEDRAAAGQPVSGIASVASFFISRVDTLIDKKLEAMTQGAHGEQAKKLLGKSAVTLARWAYQDFKKALASPRWQALHARHAQAQRLLWASTGTKNPAYSDVLYVDELIGANTVSTLPRATLNAFIDHGKVAFSVENNVANVATTLGDLAALGIDMNAIATQLENEGLTAFVSAFDTMIAALAS